MGLDVEGYLEAVTRTVSSPERDGQSARAVTLSCDYPTTASDLWNAVTNGKRIQHWFLPVSGELELGGCYQLEGNAGGMITACRRTSCLAFTWEFDGDVSWVYIHLSDAGRNQARLELTHTALLSEHWKKYGPGAVGVGWEMGFLGLAIHIARPTEPKVDEAEFATSPDGKAFIKGSSERWEEASIAAGTTPAAARAAARLTTAFYTGVSDGSA